MMEANNEMLPWEEAQAASSSPTPAYITDNKPSTSLPNPWEEAQSLYKSASQYVMKKADNLSKGIMPWEEAQQAAKVVYVKPLPPTNPADQVITKLLNTESGGKHTNPDGSLITNPNTGARGIAQIMPDSGKDPGFGIKPLQNDTKEEHIRFAKDYINTMSKRYGGDMEKTLASYNWGVGKVDKLIKKYPDDWKSKLPAETKDYISKILRK